MGTVEKMSHSKELLKNGGGDGQCALHMCFPSFHGTLFPWRGGGACDSFWPMEHGQSDPAPPRRPSAFSFLFLVLW